MAATRSLNTDARKKKKQVPFYDIPSCDTPAKIIADARRSVRPVGTERPYTPADNRNLFGGSASQSRPPSSFSIGARHFSDERSSRPATRQRLAPIERSVVEDPTIPTRKLKRKIKATPPTPVQSYQDFSVLSTFSSPPSSPSTSTSSLPQPAPHTNPTSSTSSLPPPAPPTSSTSSLPQPAHRSIPTVSSKESTVSQYPSAVGTVSSEDSGIVRDSSSGLELKQSLCSPVHSKRSVSAGTGKSIASQLASMRDTSTARVVSAGDGRKQPAKENNLRETEGKGRRDKSNRPPHESKKSVTELPYWRTEVVPLLNSLESTTYTDVQELCATCSSLWACLERRGLLGRSGGAGGTKKRSVVLRTVFKLLDHKEPRLLLKVAKVIVSMQVTGKNLLNVCKLLFSLAKEEENDQLFKTETIAGPLVEVLSLADVLKEQETLVYGLGTIKLLASSSILREEIVSADVLSLVQNTLQVCCEVCSSTSSSSSASVQPSAGDMAHTRNILIQLTGALRSLSDSPSLTHTFVSAILPNLAAVLSDHMNSADIVFNLSRVLSKLTLDPDCLQVVLRCPSLLPLFLSSLSVHSHHSDIVLRVCFILGNLTSEDNDTRHRIFFQHSPLEQLSPLYQQYLTVEVEQVPVSDQGSEEGGATGGGKSSCQHHPSKSEAVLIKLVRLFANLSVHPEVGPGIAGHQDSVDNLLMTLGHLPLVNYEELVLNVLTTLNNLSYYTQPDSYLVQRQEDLAQLMVQVMMVDSQGLLLEATRVCGNISRYPAVRDILVSNRVDQIMVTILDSGQREMVYSACGVLINILADSAHREGVACSGGVRKLVEVLHDFGRGDWQLASLVCKTLWNLSERMTSSVSCFGEEETIQLIQLLTNYSDEDFALSTSPLESGSDPQLKPTATAWQSEFLPVAESLLNRIQAHYTPLVPLPPAEESFDTSVPSVQESFDAEESMDDLPTPSP